MKCSIPCTINADRAWILNDVFIKRRSCARAGCPKKNCRDSAMQDVPDSSVLLRNGLCDHKELWLRNSRVLHRLLMQITQLKSRTHHRACAHRENPTALQMLITWRSSAPKPRLDFAFIVLAEIAVSRGALLRLLRRKAEIADIVGLFKIVSASITAEVCRSPPSGPAVRPGAGRAGKTFPSV